MPKETTETVPNLVRQSNATTCGQACIAMLRGIILEQAIKLIGHDGITSDEELLKALPMTSGFFFGAPPPFIVALQKHRDPKGDREHWTINWRGTLLDPACIGKRLWPVDKYVAIMQPLDAERAFAPCKEALREAFGESN